MSGSGGSLGHPVAATGARMLVALVHELRRRSGGIGLAALSYGLVVLEAGPTLEPAE